MRKFKVFRKRAGALALVAAMTGMLFVNNGVVAEAADGQEYLSIIRDTSNPFEQDTMERFNLTGSASKLLDTHEIQLTTTTEYENGAIFLKDKINQKTGFSLSFSMFMGESTGQAADGFVIVVAGSSNAIGATGEGIGYSGISKSIGIEYDTYDNSDSKSTPVPHVALNKNGVVDADTDSAPTTKLGWSNSKNYTVYGWIEYQQSNKKLYVRLNTQNNRATANLIDYDVDLTECTGTDYYVGFTSATGAAVQAVTLKSLYVDNKYREDGIEIDSTNYLEDAIAPTKPAITVADGKVTLDNSTDMESGLDVYQYSADGITWTNYDADNKPSASQTIYARAVDKVGNISEVETYSILSDIDDAKAELQKAYDNAVSEVDVMQYLSTDNKNKFKAELLEIKNLADQRLDEANDITELANMLQEELEKIANKIAEAKGLNVMDTAEVKKDEVVQNKVQDNEIKSVKTGDSANALLYALLLMLSAGYAGAVVVKKQKITEK